MPALHQNELVKHGDVAASQEITMKAMTELRIKIFADGADLNQISNLSLNPLIKGFTTNPTLMRKAGVDDYEAFAHDAVRAIGGKPISFEVFADEFEEMESQAMRIASWAPHVNVKIPVTNTNGVDSGPLIRRLARGGVSVNVTAVMTLEQVKKTADCLADGPSCFISVFAGRLADTGRDPVPMMAEAVRFLKSYPNIELIWASPRELLNVFQADAIGCHIITVTHDLLKKLTLVGKSPDQYSLETVRMFFNDASAAGYALACSEPIPA